MCVSGGVLKPKRMKSVKKKIYIEIDGKEYPCYPTMGAMMRYERETGKNGNDINSISDQIIFIWACCVSACKREGVEFSYNVEDFADNIDADDIQGWANAQQQQTDGEPEVKKKARR